MLRLGAWRQGVWRQGVWGLVVLLVGAIDLSLVDAEDASAVATQSFLQQFCVECHGPELQETDRRFDQLSFVNVDADGQLLMQDMVDQLTLGDMPPEGSDQPSTQQRQDAIDALQAAIRSADIQRDSTNRRTILRRLNRREYLNTIRDLFAMDLSMFDPTLSFPADNRSENLDNVGDALTTSSYLLDGYLESAEAIVEKLMARQTEQPVQQWHFKGNFPQQPELNPAHSEAFDYRYLCLYDCPHADRPEGAYGPLSEFRTGVPSDGLYEIRVLAESKNRDTPYDTEKLRIQVDEPFRLGVVPGDTRLAEQHTVQPMQTQLGEVLLRDGGPQWYSMTIPLDRGYAPRFTFQNGMFAVRDTFVRLTKEHRDLLPKSVQDVKGIFRCRKAIIRYGYLPHIRIHEVQIRGPLRPQAEDQESRDAANFALFGGVEFDEASPESNLRLLAERAYRRPVTDEEMNRLVALMEHQVSKGRTKLEAYGDAIKAVLCSPSFLYLQPMLDQDAKPEKPASASQHAIASRLSYFLWATMPDEVLRKDADEGRLSDPNVLRHHVQRMLKDPRRQGLLDGFLDGWLNLHALGDQPPDRRAFRDYYADDLQHAMRTETQTFFGHLIDANVSVCDWLTADYSFLNRDLARLYGVEDLVEKETGHRFRRVQFSDGRRGGLLGQASVLTVTANGIETSPVIRGVWMLENVLGKPTPPPPDDVPAIDPDVRGAKSIRELLDKHRSSPACNQCHRKIDPLGFAMEAFDPIGRHRSRYENGAPIDGSGKLPSGETFADIAELKQLLYNRKEFFVRHFTHRLLSYALGRRLEPLDRPAVESLVNSVRGDDYPTRDLIEGIVLGDLFTRP